MEKMRVSVLNKMQFDQLMIDNKITDETVETRDSVIFISIVDTDKLNEYAIPYFKKNHENVLNLQFDDCEHDGESSPTQSERTKAFSIEQAKEVFDFVKKHRDKETCIVHCMAGIARSAGVGFFINGYCRGDWTQFKQENPQICPNPRVLRMLNQVKRNDDSKIL